MLISSHKCAYGEPTDIPSYYILAIGMQDLSQFLFFVITCTLMSVWAFVIGSSPLYSEVKQFVAFSEPYYLCTSAPQSLTFCVSQNGYKLLSLISFPRMKFLLH